MNNFFKNNNFFRPVNPSSNYTPVTYTENYPNDERFGGGFLLPFLAGAVVSAPFWYIGANNKAQQQYYQNQPYPMYYPYQNSSYSMPSYYPYPPYRN